MTRLGLQCGENDDRSILNWLQEVEAMGTKIFVNLPVKGLKRSAELLTKLGFKFDPQFTDETATCMIHDLHIATGYDVAFGYGLGRYGETGGARCF